MSKASTKLLVATVVVAALLTVVFPAPVTAESGTVSVNAPDYASPGDEVIVLFEVTNTGEEPSSYILDLSLPEGYTIIDRVDNDGQWNSEESKWLWQTIETGDFDTKFAEVVVEIPEDARSTDTISAELKSSTGIEDTTSISLIESRLEERNVITGMISDIDRNSIENTGETRVTISRTDSGGTADTVLVDSIPLRDFDTLTSANSDVTSASFSENGNDPATYSISLRNTGGLSRYQITADRAGFETFSATTEPIGIDESTEQNIRLSSAVELNYELDIIIADGTKSTAAPIGDSVPIEVTVIQQNSGGDTEPAPAAGIDVTVEALDSSVGEFTERTLVTDADGEATTTFTSRTDGMTNISASIIENNKVFTTEDNEQAVINIFEDVQIAGNVVNDKSVGLPNAEVVLFAKQETGTFEQLASTTTSSSGAFLFTGTDGVRTGVDYRLEANYVSKDGTERTSSVELTEVSGGTNTADIVIVDTDDPHESDIVLENTVSITGSKVTIETNGGDVMTVRELPSDVEISDISGDGSYYNGSILYGLTSSELPETVSFRMNPDDSAYTGSDTVDFVVDESPVSLDVVGQSEMPAELSGEITAEQYTAVLDGDDELTAGGISRAVNQWATTGTVNGVDIGAGDLSALVNYWAA